MSEHALWAGSPGQVMPIPPVTYENMAFMWPWCLRHMVQEKAKLVKIKRTHQKLAASLRDQGLVALRGGDLGHEISRGHTQMSE